LWIYVNGYIDLVLKLLYMTSWPPQKGSRYYFITRYIMRYHILLGLTLACAAAAHLFRRDHYEGLFYEHLLKYGLRFRDGREFLQRLNIFMGHVDEVELHNNGNQTYTLGLNRFSHLTFAEFQDAVGLGGGGGIVATALMTAPSLNLRRQVVPVNVSALPAAVDWVAKGAVTPVKDQGQCGSCWAFSTTGALEGAYSLKWGTLKSFSEQELVSCDTTNKNCAGGLMNDAYTWTQKNGGLASESDYPYVSGDGTVPKCQKATIPQDAKVAPTGFINVAADSVEAMMAAVAKQPVSIAIQANQPAFQSYSGGVLTGKCGQRLDHGVLAVGYGTLNGVDYWKIKNSWSSDWGMDGYILIERSNANLCGVLSMGSYPNLYTFAHFKRRLRKRG